MDAASAIRLLIDALPGYFEQELPTDSEWRHFRAEVHDGEKWRWMTGQMRREGDTVFVDAVKWSDHP